MRELIKSFYYAGRGIMTAFSRESHLWIHGIAGVAVFLASVSLQLSAIEILLVLNAVFLVIIAEMFNTALEVLTDYISKGKKDKKAGMAKDIAAGAVLLAAFYSVIVAVYIFIPRI